MKKALWAGCLVVVGVGFAGGTVFTGKLVNAEYQRYVEAVTENYRGIANVSSTVADGFWGSDNTISIEFLELPKSVVDWAGTSTVDFDIVYSHSFLSSSSVMTLADTKLLKKIKTIQVNADSNPLVVTSDYQYDFAEGQVSVTGDIQLDGFGFGENDKQITIGQSEGEYKLTQGAVDLEWIITPSYLVSGSSKVDIGQITLKESAQVKAGDVLTALITQSSFGEVSIDSIRYTAEDAELLVQSVVMMLRQHIEGQRIILDIDYQTDFVEVDDKRIKARFEKPQLQLMLDLDLESVVLFVEKLQQLQQKTGDVFQYPEQVVAHLSTIADQGVRVDLKRLSLALKGETLSADATLKLDKLSATSNASTSKGPIDRMDLKAMLNAPKKFLEAMPNYNPAQIRMLAGFGVLVDAGESYKIELSVKDGKALMNGLPIPGI
jgi:hypothetical protein